MNTRESGDSDSWKKYLSSREVRVCEVVCGSLREIGFNEIKRITGFHQEILSRILKRLRYRNLLTIYNSKYAKCCYSSQ